MKRWFLLITTFFIIGSLLSCNDAGKNNQSLLLLLSGSGGIGNLNVVTHFAGSDGGGSYVDGAGTAAMFNNPGGITGDGTNLYVADSNNHVIRKIVILSGVVTTLAGTAGSPGSADGAGTAASFYNPQGIITDGTNLYVADSNNHVIRKIVISSGVVTTLAGIAGSTGSTDSTGTAASFYFPCGITGEGNNLYVTDMYNSTIRKIVISTGVVTTLAGTAGSTGSTDATGTAARFYFPMGITNDGTNLYVADTYNSTIRKIIISSGAVTTLAGTAGSTGSTDATGTAARFNNPGGITSNGSNLYVADTYNCTIRKIVISTQVVTTFAGTVSIGSTDGTGTDARFYYPRGTTSDGTNLYVADSTNHTIRKIVISTQVVTTLAGRAAVIGSTDDTGTAARFSSPRGITSDGTNFYVADSGNATIRKIVISSGVVTTFAGTAGLGGSTDATGTAARFSSPGGITSDGTNLYVADSSNYTIRKIVISTQIVTTLAGKAGLSGSANGAGASARFNYPTGIITDGTYLYVTDTQNHTIREIFISTGEVSTLAGTAGLNGSTDATGAAASFYYPKGITCDGNNLYVADSGNNTIRKIVISSRVVTTFAGAAGLWGSADGTGTAARFNNPSAITTDGTYLYVTDSGNDTIRKIVISTGVVTTLAGKARSSGSTDGTGSAARFDIPESIIYDSVNKKLFVADAHNNCIRMLK